MTNRQPVFNSSTCSPLTMAVRELLNFQWGLWLTRDKNPWMSTKPPCFHTLWELIPNLPYHNHVKISFRAKYSNLLFSSSGSFPQFLRKWSFLGFFYLSWKSRRFAASALHSVMAFYNLLCSFLHWFCVCSRCHEDTLDRENDVPLHTTFHNPDSAQEPATTA